MGLTHAIRFAKRARLSDPETDDHIERVADAVELTSGVIVEVPGPCPSRAGTAFMVTHNYGQRPDWVGMIDNGDQGGIIYATTNDKAAWTSTTAKVRCTVANEVGLVIQFTRRP